MVVLNGKLIPMALLGRRDAPTDALEDYCTCLGGAFAVTGARLEQVRVPWAERGWLPALASLYRASAAWRGRWVLAQYTALGWSRRGFPIGFLAVLGLLRRRGTRCVIVFHDTEGFSGDRTIDRLRRLSQHWVMRIAYRWAERSILTVPLDRASWLPSNSAKATFIPVGANLPARPNPTESDGRRARRWKTIGVFGVTGREQIPREVEQISYAVSRVAQHIPELRLVVFGRGSPEAGELLRKALQETPVQIAVLGLLPSEELSRVLGDADVLLFVRGQVSTRRGTAIAAIACGRPIVGYQGSETSFPITEAGVVLVPEGDCEALVGALCRVLSEDRFREELCQRSLRAHEEYFSWEAIATRFLQVLVHA